MKVVTEDNVFGPVHHHHAADGSVSIEHRHHTFFEGALDSNGERRGPHEHFEPTEGARCDCESRAS